MIEYQILYWRDIPVQIKLYAGKRPKSYQLPEHFQTCGCMTIVQSSPVIA